MKRWSCSMMFALMQTSLHCRAAVQVFCPPNGNQPTPHDQGQQTIHVEQARRVRPTLVNYNFVTPPVIANSFSEERSGCGFVTGFRQHKIKGFSHCPAGDACIADRGLVDCPVQIGPLAFDLHIVSSIRHELPVGAFRRCASSAIAGEYFAIHRFSVAWSKLTPRSAMISSRSRYETGNRT